MLDKDKLTHIKKGEQNWQGKISKKDGAALSEAEPCAELELPTKRIYTPLDLGDFDYSRDLEFPGEYPFTRGIHPTMYRGRLWSVAEYAGFGTPEETNQRYKFLMKHGETGLSVASDLPTQLGYDSDHPLAEREVGVIGVSCSSIKEVETLFDGISLDKVSVRSSISALHPVFWSMVLAVAENRGINPDKLTGTIVTDCLQEYLARGNYIFPPADGMRLSLDMAEFTMKHVPRWNFLVSAHSIREAGSSLIQEGAFGLSIASTFIEEVGKRGMDIEKFASRLAFNFSIQMNFFEEIAKFRALRRLWARIIKEKFGLTSRSAQLFRVGPGTSGAALTAQEPQNNIIRVALECLAGVLGGVQYLHTSSYDEAYAIPTEEAVTVALSTQQIIAHETGIPQVVDPLGGSYYIESLTNTIEKSIEEYMEKINGAGGMVRAIETGWAQKEISKAAFDHHKDVEEGKRIIVGVNKFHKEQEREIETHEANPAVVKDMQNRLARLRKERDNTAFVKALDKLRKAAEGQDNIVPCIVQAVKSYATIGEISGVLREVFGEYNPTFF